MIQPVDSTPTGTEILFGCTFKHDTYDLFCSDSGVGAVYLSFNASSSLYKVTNNVPTAKFGNGTNCWSQRDVFEQSPNYLSPVDKNYIVSFSKANGRHIATTDSNTLGSSSPGVSKPQLIEPVTASNFIYDLSFGSSTSVTTQYILVAQGTSRNGDLNLVQNVQIRGVTNSVSGLALFVRMIG